MPKDVGTVISFTKESIPSRTSDALWADSWDNVSPCQNISADGVPKKAYIFQDLACAGDDLERFDGAVFVSKPPTTGNGS